MRNEKRNISDLFGVSTVSPIGCYQRALWMSIGMLFLLLPLSLQAQVWTEILVAKNAVSKTARWCGVTHTVVWLDDKNGVNLSDIATGKTKNIGYFSSQPELSCSLDGEYVLVRSTKTSSVVDVSTGKISQIDCLNRDVFLSPSMGKVFAPRRTCEGLTMPRGRKLDVIHLSAVDYKDYWPPRVLAWSPNEDYVLLSMKKRGASQFDEAVYVAAHHLSSNKLFSHIALPNSPYRVKWSRITNRALFLMPSQASRRLSLYQVNMLEANMSFGVLIHDVYRFDLTSDGTIFYLAEGVERMRNLYRTSEKDVSHAAIISNETWDEGPYASFDGIAVIVEKGNKFAGNEGPEGPPVTSSIVVFSQMQ